MSFVTAGFALGVGLEPLITGITAALSGLEGAFVAWGILGLAATGLVGSSLSSYPRIVCASSGRSGPRSVGIFGVGRPRILPAASRPCSMARSKKM